MPLLNYTTKVPVKRTIDEIHTLLVKAGARSFMTDYDDDGKASGIAFRIVTPLGQRAYTLPVQPKKVYDVLLRDGEVAARRGANFTTPEQAERIAWRILKDWVEVQLAIIETEMVTLDQVMLPYMQSDDGRTMYELYVDRQLALTSGASA
jgi:hypothetical protein